LLVTFFALQLRVGLPYSAFWLAVGLLLVHFVALPRVAAAQIPMLEQRMVVAAQRDDAEGMARAYRSARLVRLYSPAWYLLGRRAWIASEQGELARAEALYSEAILEAREPERSTFIANLTTLKRRLGKEEEAAALQRRLNRDRPDLARVVEEARRD
jgi:tetratricopeptide (TPR) repeat protein